MHILLLPLLFIYCLSKGLVYPGNLFVTSIDNVSCHKRIGIKDDHIVLTDKVTIFSYGTEGTLKVTDTGQYLHINEAGNIFLDYGKHWNFHVTEGDWPVVRNLTYARNSEFHLCEDNSLGYKTNCRGARKITISYEDAFGQRDKR